MRALVLLLLSGCVLWLVLRGLDTEPVEAAATGGESVRGDGYFLPVGEPVRPNEPFTTPAEPEASTQVPAPEPSGSGTSPAAAQADDPLPSSVTTRISVSPDAELEMARELAHRPQAVGAWLVERDRGISSARRALVIAVSQAIEGDPAALRQLAHEPGEGEEPAGTPHELSLLEEALRPGTVRTRAASVARGTPLVLATYVALAAREADQALAEGRAQEAAAGYSDLLQAELEAPWNSDPEMLRRWSDSLAKAQRGHQWNRKGGWPSIEVTVERGDSLISLRKRVLQQNPDLLVCTGLIARVNELNGDTIHPGQVLRIPRERARMLVDISARWAVLFLGDQAVGAWEVGVGAPESPTPPGLYTVGDKNTEPMWFRPGKPPVPHGSAENPLGTRWIAWLDETSRPTRLAFHGTKDPESIGTDQSQGCVRMRNRDVEELFEILPVGSKVEVRP